MFPKRTPDQDKAEDRGIDAFNRLTTCSNCRFVRWDTDGIEVCGLNPPTLTYWKGEPNEHPFKEEGVLPTYPPSRTCAKWEPYVHPNDNL